jgi:hypothetical protein
LFIDLVTYICGACLPHLATSSGHYLLASHTIWTLHILYIT